jgi:hypothetical protein
MATVVADMSMSLDGFVAGPDDRIDEVFSWMSGGDVAVETSNPDRGPGGRRSRLRCRRCGSGSAWSRT